MLLFWLFFLPVTVHLLKVLVAFTFTCIHYSLLKSRHSNYAAHPQYNKHSRARVCVCVKWGVQSLVKNRTDVAAEYTALHFDLIVHSPINNAIFIAAKNILIFYQIHMFMSDFSLRWTSTCFFRFFQYVD